jgi:cytoskeletal protein CcmA (bactofilin family)
MLQSLNPSKEQKPQFFSNPQTLGTTNGITPPVEQATIGRSMVIKGEVTAGESLFVDGRIDGTITVSDHRVTIGRNGSVHANINAREVVIMGKVQGNVQCTDRLDIRGEGSLTGDVITQRISVEDGAWVKGAVEVRQAADQKRVQAQPAAQPAKPLEVPKPANAEAPKALGAAAGN